MALNFATKDLVRWTWFLIALEVLYVIVEISFNSAILNASAGLVWSRDSINTLEHVGRTLSGVGCGLMVFGFLGIKRTKFSYRLKMLAITMAITVPAMYFGQKILIDEIVINRASDSLLEKADRSMVIKRAYQSGAYSIDSIGFDNSKVANPEEMSLLSMMGLLVLESDKWDAKLKQSGSSILKDTFVSINKASSEKAWTGYSEASREIDGAWTNYYRASKQFRKERDAQLSSSGQKTAWANLVNDVKPSFQSYINSRSQYEDSIIQEAKRKGFAKQLESKFDRMDICRTSDSCRRTHYNRLHKLIKKYAGIDKPLNYWCSERACPASRPVLYKRLIAAKIAQGDFKNRTGFSYYIKDIASFMRYERVYSEIAARLKSQGFGDTSRFRGTYSSFSKMYKERVYLVAAKEWYQNSGDAYGLPPNLTRSEFNNTAIVQNSLRAIFGLSADDKYVVKLGMSKSSFMREFNHKALNVKVSSEIKRLAAGAAKAKEETREEYKDALRGLIVPPIALVLSLFFSLFTLIRIPLRFISISFLYKPEQWKVKLKKTLMVMDLMFVLSFPLLKPDNKLAKKEVVEETFKYFGKDMSVFGGWAFKWYMNAEPILYPIGNAILNAVGINNIDHPSYESKEGSRNVKATEFSLHVEVHQPVFNSLTRANVREAQSLLNKVGFNVGGVDGVAGKNTIKKADKYAQQLGFYSSKEGDNPYNTSGSTYVKNGEFTTYHFTLALMAR